MRRNPLAFMVLIALAILAQAGFADAAGELGDSAALVVPELDGKSFDLAALRGKVIIVNFWATWCPPCRKEMPALDAVYRRYHPQGLEMLGLSADRPRDRSEVEKIMKSFSYPAAMLDDATSNSFGSPAALPVTYLIGRDGIVRARLTPDQASLTEQSLEAIVTPLLGSKAASNAPGAGASLIRMIKPAMLAIAVLAGCASSSMAPPNDPRFASAQAQEREIAAREQRCIDRSTLSEADRIAAAVGRIDGWAALRIEAAGRERVAAAAGCRAEAALALDALAPGERAEYAFAARDERSRAALMATLTSSHPR